MKIDKTQHDTFVDLGHHRKILKELDGKICLTALNKAERIIEISDNQFFLKNRHGVIHYFAHIANIRIMDGIISDVVSTNQWEIVFEDEAKQKALDRIKVLEEELAKLKKIIEE